MLAAYDVAPDLVRALRPVVIAGGSTEAIEIVVVVRDHRRAALPPAAPT